MVVYDDPCMSARFPPPCCAAGYSSKDLLFFRTSDGRAITSKSKTRDLTFQSQTCPVGHMVQVRARSNTMPSMMRSTSRT